MTGSELLTQNMMYLLDTWNDDGEITNEDYQRYSKIAKRGKKKEKLELWYNLVGSHFDVDE